MNLSTVIFAHSLFNRAGDLFNKQGMNYCIQGRMCLVEVFFEGDIKMQVLKINGAERQFLAGMPQTLTELLGQLNINEATVVAEIDGQIINRQNFAQTQLSNGQSIELVRFVGGG